MDWIFRVVWVCDFYTTYILLVTMVICSDLLALLWVQLFSCLPIHFAVSTTDLYLVMRNVPYIGAIIYSI